MSFWTRHQVFEKNSIILVVGILLVIAIGGLVEITPLFYLKSTIEKVDGMRPYTPDMIASAKADVTTQGSADAPEAADLAKRYPKAQSRDYDGNPGRITEADALIAYLQVLGTLVDFKLYNDKANIR